METSERTGVVRGNFDGDDKDGPTGSRWDNVSGTAGNTGDTEIILADKEQRLPNS